MKNALKKINDKVSKITVVYIFIEIILEYYHTEEENFDFLRFEKRRAKRAGYLLFLS
jgi:hypothetical protein